MDQRHIVALEIGSSKIKGLIASIGDLGEINVIAIEETHVIDCVRYGRIQNIQEVSTRVNDIIRKLENNPHVAPRKITDIFVALGGRSLSTVTAQAQAKFPSAIEITADTVERLKREASFGLVTDKTTLEMLSHTFFVDNSEVKNVVGVVGSQLRAVFTAIVISPINQSNLNRIKFDGRNIRLHTVIRPTALADLVLSSSEKQLGCALVDFGAETTTVAIYKDDVLQSIVTLPVGSRNITRDLMIGMSMTEERAEAAKADSSSAVTADAVSSTDAEINSYISARAGEIVANILHQIEAAGFKTALPAGIVLTGRGAMLHNFDRLVEAQSKMPVRIAAIDGTMQFTGNKFERNSNIDILAIAKYCAGKSTVDCLEPAPELPEQDNSYVDDNDDTYTHDDNPRRRDYRRIVDEDNLLEDDSDDVPTTDAGHRVTGKTSRTVRNVRPVDDYDDNADTVYDENIDDDDRPSFKSKITLLKEKLAGFWTKPIDGEEDDLDSPAN